MANYGSLVGSGLTFAGVDQGIDFTGRGHVFALGNGIVTRAIRKGSGWPGEGAILVYLITSGRGKGRYVYIAEDFAISAGLKVGSHVKAGQVLGLATGTGKAPGIEIGWANSSGKPVAALGKNKRAQTGAGKDFLSFVTSSEVAAPTTSPAAGTDTGQAEGAAATLPDFSQPAPLQGVTAGPPGVLDPGTVPAGGFSPHVYQQLWQTIASQPGASPDTLDYAKLVTG